MKHSCTNCAALRERVRELERELGRRMISGGVMTLITDLGLRPTAARAVMLLYQARGRFIETENLMELASFNTRFNMRSTFWVIRQRLGDDFIQSAWGHGYRLGPDAMARVAKVLEQAMVEAA